MDLVMQRLKVDSTGCFSQISTLAGAPLWVTAEHSYQQPDGTWLPKIPLGVYQCVRGVHELSDLVPFETFEVTPVQGHSGILFHKGNLPEQDSDGCILLGTTFGELNGEPAVLQSSMAFQGFLNLQQGLYSFNLTVK